MNLWALNYENRGKVRWVMSQHQTWRGPVACVVGLLLACRALAARPGGRSGLVHAGRGRRSICWRPSGPRRPAPARLRAGGWSAKHWLVGNAQHLSALGLAQRVAPVSGTASGRASFLMSPSAVCQRCSVRTVMPAVLQALHAGSRRRGLLGSSLSGGGDLPVRSFVLVPGEDRL